MDYLKIPYEEEQDCGVLGIFLCARMVKLKLQRKQAVSISKNFRSQRSNYQTRDFALKILPIS